MRKFGNMINFTSYVRSIGRRVQVSSTKRSLSDARRRATSTAGADGDLCPSIRRTRRLRAAREAQRPTFRLAKGTWAAMGGRPHRRTRGFRGRIVPTLDAGHPPLSERTAPATPPASQTNKGTNSACIQVLRGRVREEPSASNSAPQRAMPEGVHPRHTKA